MNANRTENRTRLMRWRRTRRRGYSIIELALALFLFMTAMGLTVKVLGWVGTERRGADRRLWAVQVVSNVMDRLSAEPFESVTADRARTIADEAAAGKAVPGASWEIAVNDEREAVPPAKRVSLQLHWNDRSGGWDGPVRLTSWVYRRRNPS
jgi:hypothetical protein